MEISIDNRCGSPLPLQHIEELARFVLEAEGLPKNTELSVSFVGLAEISELNSTYRNKTGPTDILSFELDDPWDASITQEDDQVFVGDIVINPDIAQKNAALEEVTLEEELWVLVIHGILHLVGYDHIEPEDARVMEHKEDKYFEQWELKLGVW